MIQNARKFFPLLDLLAITLVVYMATGTLYRGIWSGMIALPASPQGGPSAAPAFRGAPAPLAPLSPQATAAIVDRDLFNTQAPKPDASKPVDVQALSDTALRLRLIGTVAGGSNGRAFAVIEDASLRKQELYRVGDTVQSALVKAILRQLVVLEEAGRETRLRMEDQKSGGSAGEGGARADGSSSGADEKNVRVSRQELESSLKNVNQLMTQVRVRPHFTMGKPDGLAMNRILPDSIFNKMGLENGDVIQAVGDQKIKSVEDVMTLYKSLKNDENVTLQVQRRGAPATLRYSME